MSGAMTPSVRFYTRRIGHSTGTQLVMAVAGVIVSQDLAADRGWFTGPGNPALVGQPIAALRGKGFSIVRRNSRREYDLLETADLASMQEGPR